MNLKYTFFILTASMFFNINAQNRALSFVNDDLVQTTFQGPTGNASRTVEAWIKTTANCIPNAGGIQQVIVDWGTFVNTQRFTMNLLWSNALRIEVGGNGLSGSIAVNDGVWHHVAVVYNSLLATNQYTLYVDGVMDTQGNLTVATNTGTSVNMRIGQRVDGVNNFNGEIDEVRIFNFPRTLTQINADKDQELCSTTTGLLAYYKLNEGIPNVANTSNTIAKDYSGNNNNGVLNNFTLSGTSSNWVNGPVISPRSSYATFMVNGCNSYSSPSGNYTWTVSGIYQDTIPNISGCDSIMTIDVQLGSAQSNLAVSECVSYTSPSGNVYTSSAMFLDTLINGSASGCDSIININLTVGSSISNLDTTVCGSYSSPGGNVFYSSANFIDTLVGASASGCDSLINTQLIVGAISSTASSLTICEDSILVDGNWYFTNQIVDVFFSSSLGCDSTHSISLFFENPSFEVININSCGTYTSPSGQTYGSSTIFVESFTNQAGCDSVIEYNLTVFNPTTTPVQSSRCDSASINGTMYYTSQTITYVLTDVNGCDSTVIVDLTINEVDASVTLSTDNVISATQYIGASYTWYNCEADQVVSALNNYEYSPNVSGDYKVEIGYLGCLKESECLSVQITAITNLLNESGVVLKPNPNKGLFKVNLKTNENIRKYEIINILGQSVQNLSNLNSKKITISENLENGLYFLKISSEKNNYLKQFIVD